MPLSHLGNKAHCLIVLKCILFEQTQIENIKCTLNQNGTSVLCFKLLFIAHFVHLNM